MRVIMPVGIVDLCLEGDHYPLDEESGTFEVPEKYRDDVLRVHGGREAPSIQHLEVAVGQAVQRLQDAHELVVLRTRELEQAMRANEAAKKTAEKQREAAATRRVPIPPRTTTQTEGQGGNAST